MIELDTDRLLLRPVKDSDVDDIFEYSCNPDVGPHAGWKPHEDQEETQKIMKEIFMEQEAVFGIVRKQDDKLIGTIGLTDDPKRENMGTRMLGYAIGKPYWGAGFVTEASKAIMAHGFEQLGLELISCYCYSVNQRSRRVIEKCGMKYEGSLRMAERRYDDIVFDLLCFSITKEEYVQQK